MCPCSVTFQHFNGLGLGKTIDQSCYRASVGNVINLVFARDAALLTASLEVQVMTLEVLQEEDATGTKNLLDQSQGPVVWRFAA